MSLIGTPFLAFTVVVAIALTLGTFALWNRMRGPAPLRTGLRLGLLLAAQAAAVLVVLVSINDNYLLYDSWRDLTDGASTATTLETAAAAAAGGDGTPAGAPGALGLPPVPGRPGLRSGLHPDFHPAGPDLLGAQLTGARSGLHGSLYVWLPPEYDDPAHLGERFPVVELLPGQPGSPLAWFQVLQGQRTLQRLVSAGQARPMILVSAMSNTLGGSDAGCADLPGGPHTQTWLGVDVPALVRSEFRASADPADWSVMGFSAGGYCSTDLLVHFPGVFHSAVSLSGYTDPEAPVVLSHPALARRENPRLVMLAARPQPDVDLLMAGSLEDGRTVPDARAMIAVLRPPAEGDLLTVDRGGHTVDVWVAMLPEAFRWISRHLR